MTDIWSSIFLVSIFLLLALLIFHQYRIIKKMKFESDNTVNRDYKMLNLLMEHSPDVIFSVDQNFNYLAFNNSHFKTMKNSYGVKIELGKNILDYMRVKDDDDNAKKDIQRALNGESFSIIRTYGDEDHKRSHFEATYTPIKVDETVRGAAVFVRDVTEQHLSNLNIQRSERKYKLLFHYNFLGTLIMKDGVINDANDKAESFLGMETHELVGNTLSDLFQIQSDATVEDQIKEFFTTYIHPSGEKLYFVIREQTVFDFKENHQTVFIENVTSKYKAEQELIKVNLQRQVLIESAKSYIFSINTDFKIETFNTKFKELLEEQLNVQLSPNMNLKSFDHVKHLNFYIEQIQIAIETKKLHEVEYEISNNLILQSAISPLLDKENNVSGVAVYSIDITEEITQRREINLLNTSLEQKVRERTSELEEQRLKLDLAMNAAKIAAWSYIEGVGFEWDDKFSEVLGFVHGIEYANFNNIIDIVLDEDKKRVLDIVSQIRNKKIEEFDLTVKIDHPEKGEQYIQLYGRSSNNDRYEMYGVSWNITEQKNSEFELEKAKEEAEKSNQAKSMFLANMSHEIRSPLNAIIGFSNILFKKSETLQLSDEYLEQLKYIYLNGEYLSELINNLLDLSKIDAGKLSVYLEDIDIRDLINMVVKIHEVTANERSIKIHLHIDEKIPEKVLLDSTKSRQILTNLLSNAIKFSKKDTSIFVDIVRSEEQILIQVKDQGIGIPKDKLNLIFDSFEQGDNSVTRKFGGTGLGLAITKKLASMMKGRVEVYSEENIGTTFSVYLPLNVNQSKIAHQSNVAKEEQDYNFNFDVLVVEDNKMNQMMMSALLNQLKVNIAIANNGEEAINMIQKKSFDLILMDLHMPILGGIDATKIIRFELGLLDVPIVALTADTYWDKRFDAFSAGMNDYLTKPLSRPSLIHILDKYLLDNENKEMKYLDPIKHKEIIKELKEITITKSQNDNEKLRRLRSLRHLLQDYDTGFVEYIDFVTSAIANNKEIEIF
ncbi:response regulator [Flammeovirga yaeyamensis]|uniref:histidine kinase n=1 Tax=Flammeovirga yaeyamensis TaxID=367791 RepID=A0AAX1N9B2_9BACT|nr:ATP-binding protein [Flammeovirga yaeyamensis]MBB3698861.1 PAS domain S-box-containing protein [Flammeovirga yaeyamensis]NMF37446.1 response regulator [Flammeovirga yaeyamensis]QWG03741.1 response regulator [Flammeovirga yaeyamensis]